MEIKDIIKAIFDECIKECISKTNEKENAISSMYVFGKDKNGENIQFLQATKVNVEGNDKTMSNVVSDSGQDILLKNCDFDAILSKNLTSFERNAMKFAGYDKEKIQKTFNEKISEYHHRLCDEKQKNDDDVCLCFFVRNECVKILPYVTSENYYLDEFSLDVLIDNISI